jgi:hypothetical protein
VASAKEGGALLFNARVIFCARNIVCPRTVSTSSKAMILHLNSTIGMGPRHLKGITKIVYVFHGQGAPHQTKFIAACDAQLQKLEEAKSIGRLGCSCRGGFGV